MAIKSKISEKIDRLRKWRPFSNMQKMSAHFTLGPLVGMLGIVSLTLLYSNCGEMKSLKSQSDLGSEEGVENPFDSEINTGDGYLTGNISFSKPEVTEGESVLLHWDFKWAKNGNDGYFFSSFSCPISSEIGDGISFLGVGNTCKPDASGAPVSCNSHISGAATLLPKANSDPNPSYYNCTIVFENVATGSKVASSVALKVNIPANRRCEGNELWQGNFDGCNSSVCWGWAFNYGQVSLPITLKVTQSGAKNRTATITTATTSKRGDVNQHLSDQGCLTSGNLLTGFSVSTGDIDNELKKASATTGSGSTSSFKIEASTVGGRLLGTQSYQPQSEIDPPPPPAPVCEGAELTQGNFERCDGSSCVGWAFQYQQSQTSVRVDIEQHGLRRRSASFSVKTNTNRSDVDKHLEAQGCLSPSRPLTQFSFGQAQIDSALKDAPVLGADGTGSSIQVTFSTGGKVIGVVSDYHPLSQIDPEPPTPSPMTVASGGLRVSNVPLPSEGTLFGCFEYDKDYGPQNQPGSCGGQGTTAILGNGWSYDSASKSASCNCDSSVFGGRHGSIFFTFQTKYGIRINASGSF